MNNFTFTIASKFNENGTLSQVYLNLVNTNLEQVFSR